MGYDTYFSGELEVSPPITEAHAKEYEELRNEQGNAQFPNQPGGEYSWNPLQITAGTLITFDDITCWYDHEEWIQYIMNWLRERGYTPDGTVWWDGEASTDQGYYVIHSMGIDVHLIPNDNWPIDHTNPLDPVVRAGTARTAWR